MNEIKENLRQFAEIGIGIANLVTLASPAELTVHCQNESTSYCAKGFRLSLKKNGIEVAAKSENLLDAINLLIDKTSEEVA